MVLVSAERLGKRVRVLAWARAFSRGVEAWGPVRPDVTGSREGTKPRSSDE
jgi:hypothetical protein